MNKNDIEALAYLFNRSDNQILFLLSLIDYNLDILIELETKIKENFIHYCPASKESIDEILKFKFKKDFDIETIKNKLKNTCTVK